LSARRSRPAGFFFSRSRARAQVALLAYHLRLVALGERTSERVKGVWDGKAKPHDRGCCGNYVALCCARTPPSHLPNLRAKAPKPSLRGHHALQSPLPPASPPPSFFSATRRPL